ncbi:MAG: tmk [Ilumatobacteraceae bacterium]|nr:tmk [Ilumatobacteraceae bacterium]
MVRCDMSTVARYIALEGAEACGKSTQAAKLAIALDAVLTRETGGTPIGSRIRDILHDNATTGLSHRAEALLTAADRAQHIEQIVGPALAAGQHVVSDRSVHSTLAYQGYGRQLPVDEIRTINRWAVDGCWPDLAILLDVDEVTLERRMRGRHLDRFELEDVGFHSRVRHGFRTMADDDPQHWVVLDGSRPADEVAVAVREAVRQRLDV